MLKCGSWGGAAPENTQETRVINWSDFLNYNPTQLESNIDRGDSLFSRYPAAAFLSQTPMLSESVLGY